MTKSEFAITRLHDLNFTDAELERLARQGWTPEAVLKDINRLFDAGLTTESYARETFEEANPELFGDHPPASYVAKTAAEFGEDNTRFLWYPFLPIGDYTVLMAPGGTGKTYFVCGVAAAVSNGDALPGDDTPNDGSHTVLIISAEDRGELLKRRLRACGANLDKVYIIDCMNSVGLDFTKGFETFKATVQAYKPKLVIVDPWHGFLGADIDINRVNAIRPVFQRLANLAKDCDCSLILVSHVNKRAQGENINHAATGSTDFINAARSALYVLFDEEDEDGRIVVHTKSNYARHGQSVKFRIGMDGGVVWNGFSEIDRQTMEEAARHRKTPGEVVQNKAATETFNQALVSALMDAANPFEIVRFTYDGFKAAYGSGIFGTMQPKRALDSVTHIMEGRGYEIRTGIKVKRNGSPENGFAITGIQIGDE